MPRYTCPSDRTSWLSRPPTSKRDGNVRWREDPPRVGRIRSAGWLLARGRIGDLPSPGARVTPPVQARRRPDRIKARAVRDLPPRARRAAGGRSRPVEAVKQVAGGVGADFSIGATGMPEMLRQARSTARVGAACAASSVHLLGTEVSLDVNEMLAMRGLSAASSSSRCCGRRRSQRCRAKMRGARRLHSPEPLRTPQQGD